METLKLGEDIYVISELEIQEITFVGKGLKREMLLSLDKEDLKILIPWLQSRIAEFEKREKK